MVQQAVEQGACRVAGSRMHDESRRLVDDDEVVILVEDIQVDLLGGILDDSLLDDL